MPFETLQSQAIRALAGADYVREQLLTALAMGPSSFFRTCYAIKCRIKAEDRLISKVHDRRKNRREYSPEDVTDIVGLRLLTLFSDDLPSAVDDFIEFIQFCQSPRLSLFTGSNPKDTIREALVYSSNLAAPIYRSVFDKLLALNLPAFASGIERVRYGASSEDKPYSSIHIVCTANSYYAGNAKLVPVEIQIRTAFEDVWAEIDHSRRYKASAILSAQSDDTMADRFAKTIATRLGDLKNNLDSCSRTADHIKTDFDFLSKNQPKSRVSTNTRRHNRVGYSDLAPASIKALATNLDADLGKLYKEIIPEEETIAQDFSIETFADRFDDAERKIDGLNAKYKEVSPDLFEEDLQFAYVIEMERAFLSYWRARAVKKSDKFSADLFDDYIDMALRTYYKVADMNVYHFDSILWYRVGQCFLLWAKIDLALDNFRKAVDLLEDDRVLDRDSHFRATLPRQLGTMLWLKYDQLVQQLDEAPQRSALGSQAVEFLKEAYRVTLSAYRNISRNAPNLFTEFPREEILYGNNMLYYLVEYVRVKGREVALRELTSDLETVSAAYEKLATAATTPARIDTCARVAQFLGDKARWLAHVERLRKELNTKENVVAYTERELQRMWTTVQEAAHDHT